MVKYLTGRLASFSLSFRKQNTVEKHPSYPNPSIQLRGTSKAQVVNYGICYEMGPRKNRQDQ